MCGIAGIWGPADRAAVARMVGAMHHRGPDQHGLFQAGPVALGMSRLSILDRSDAGRQPMSNADETVTLVYNGELYNYAAARAGLEARGCAFRSTSDTEVVLRLYELHGDDCLLKMRGMFALAVLDRRRGPGRERLLLARDPFGIKPLLYAPLPGGLVFGSEMKALLASGLVGRELDPVALRMLLTFGSVYQPRTLLRGVRMLPPAHRLILEGDRHRIERYWSLGVDRRPGLRALPYGQQVEALTEALEESVRLQMLSDVPLGAFLSGGIDSGLLVALMTRITGRPVRTYSVGFGPEGAAIDETADADRMARHLGAQHHTVRVTGEQVRDRLEHFVAALDQPSVDGLNAYFVSRAARAGVTVAISGTGGDELFAGYPWFRNMVQAEQAARRQPVRSFARTVLAALARQPVFDGLQRHGHPRLCRARDGAGFVTRYANNYQIFGVLGSDRVLSAGWRQPARAGRALHYDVRPADELPHAETVDRVAALCLRGYTANQLLRDIDAVSMAHSLEVRVPFLDPKVLDLALSLPGSTKLGPVNARDSTTVTYRDSGAKRILIDVAKPLLPEGFDRQPKRGFGLPLSEWLRGPLRQALEDNLADDVVRRRGWFDPAAVADIKRRFLGGQLAWPQPWLLLVLELWTRTVLEH
jgi:asparagine synthase (glutamine-hydrolysing)